MLPEKPFRKRLKKAPRKVDPDVIRMKAKELAKHLLSPKDYEWEEMTIEGVEGSEMDWSTSITSESMRISISVNVTPMQASCIICSVKDLDDMMLYPSPYQVIENLLTIFKASANCVIIDSNSNDLLMGKIEMTLPGGETIYHTLSAGDALAFAATTHSPVYMLRGLVNRLTE